MAAPLLSVLIVNYNGAARLAACLAALEQQTFPRYRFEVIVFDNASADDSMEVVPPRFPWVRFVASEQNLGFAEGNNTVARFAHGDVLVPLNNDTLPDPFWLEELDRIMQRQPGQAVASKLVFEADPRMLNSAGLCLLRDGRGLDAGFRQLDDGRWEAGGPAFAGCGAAVAMPRTDRLFDPNLFLYSEDLDAGWRGQLVGTATVTAPRSLVRHAHGAAAGEESPLVRFHVERNRALVSLTNADLWLALWTGVGLCMKVPQAVLRAVVKPTRARWRTAVAVAEALCSYLDRLPDALVERYLVRCWPVRRP